MDGAPFVPSLGGFLSKSDAKSEISGKVFARKCRNRNKSTKKSGKLNRKQSEERRMVIISRDLQVIMLLCAVLFALLTPACSNSHPNATICPTDGLQAIDSAAENDGFGKGSGASRDRALLSNASMEENRLSLRKLGPKTRRTSIDRINETQFSF